MKVRCPTRRNCLRTFMRNTFLTILIVLLAFSAHSVSVSAQGRLTRRTALSRIKKCSVKLSAFNCDENNAELLISLYNKGNKALLNPLLDANRKSDGALSALLGTFYADVLQKQTVDFLSALKKRNKKEQIDLAKSAIRADGGGNLESWTIDTKKRLRRYTSNKNNKLYSVAKICLKEMHNFSNN